MWSCNQKNIELQTEYMEMCLRHCYPVNEHYFQNALKLLKPTMSQQEWDRVGELSRAGRKAEQEFLISRGESLLEPFDLSVDYEYSYYMKGV